MLVPGKLKEEVFWRNYFYKCDLLISSYLKMAGTAPSPAPAAATAAGTGASPSAAAPAVVCAPPCAISCSGRIPV